MVMERTCGRDLGSVAFVSPKVIAKVIPIEHRAESTSACPRCGMPLWLFTDHTSPLITSSAPALVAEELLLLSFGNYLNAFSTSVHLVSVTIDPSSPIKPKIVPVSSLMYT
jgi:hypothetical protein